MAIDFSEPCWQVPSATADREARRAADARRIANIKEALGKPMRYGTDVFASKRDCAKYIAATTGKSVSYILAILCGVHKPKNFGVGSGNYPRKTYIYNDRIFHTLKALARHVGRDTRTVKKHYDAGTLAQIDARAASRSARPAAKRRTHFHATRGEQATGRASS